MPGVTSKPITSVSTNGGVNTVVLDNTGGTPNPLEITVPDGPMWTLVCGAKVPGDTLTADWTDSGTPVVHTATNVKRP